MPLKPTGTTTPNQNGPGNNGNERLIHFTESSRTGVSPSGVV